MSIINVPKIGKIHASVLEVTAFPQSSLLSDDSEKAFEMLMVTLQNLISEFYNITNMDKSALEILWLTQPVKNQTFRAIPHLYIIFRNIGVDEKWLESEADAVISNINSILVQSKYEVNIIDVDSDDFVKNVNNVSSSTLFTIVKPERIFQGPFTGEWYYGWDTADCACRDSMSSLINSLSQCDNAAISFQLIPTMLTPIETSALSTLLNTYQMSQDFSDTNCNRLLQSYRFVSERAEKPFFYYNISVAGEKEDCKILATKLVSLLQAGDVKISTFSPLTLDLTKENISFTKQFYIYPWLLNSALINKYRRADILQYPIVQLLNRMPYLMTIEEISSFFRPPLYDKSMASLKEKRGSGDAEQFSSDVIGENTIKIGNLVSGSDNKVSIGVPFKSWTQHALVVGMPGTGKTTFAVNILTQFAKNNIPFLAIEPTKAEYRAMIDTVDNLQIFTPGNNGVSPFIINPFIPPIGITVEQYTPSLLSAFKAAFSMDGPLEMIFLKAVNAAYVEYGWKQNSKYGDPGTAIFGMFEYILCFKKIMKSMNYSKETQGNIETAGLLRLMNLIEQNANIYDTVNTIPIEDLLKNPTVLELNSIENEEQKALIMALLLSSICIYTKINQKGDGKLKNVILIDEAHVLLDSGADSENSGSSKGTTVKTIQKMIAEIRSYGTSIIIADQKPSKVTDDIVANTNVKVSFRLTSPKERTMIGESTDMKEADIDYLSRLTIGQAYVHFDKLNSPQLVQTEDTRERDGIRLSVNDEEIIERSKYWTTRAEKLIPYRECKCSANCSLCSFKIRNDAEYYASYILDKKSNGIKDKESFMKSALLVTIFLKQDKIRKMYSEKDFKILNSCSIIRFVRKAELSTQYTLSLKDISKVISISERMIKDV